MSEHKAAERLRNGRKRAAAKRKQRAAKEQDRLERVLQRRESKVIAAKRQLENHVAKSRPRKASK